MLFRRNLLSSALLWLDLFICLANCAPALASNGIGTELSETPGPVSMQHVRQKRSPELTAEQMLEGLIDKEVEERDKKMVDNKIQFEGMTSMASADCPLPYDVLRNLLRSGMTNHLSFSNGVFIADVLMRGMKEYKSLTCVSKLLRALYSAQAKFSETTTRAGRCIRSFIEKNLSEYIKFCARLNQQEVVKSVRRELGLEDDKMMDSETSINVIVNREIKDASFVDPQLSKMISKNMHGECPLEPEQLKLLFEAVDNKDNTWLGGHEVKFFLELTKHMVWNCDEIKFLTYLIAEDHAKHALKEEKKCIISYYRHYVYSLSSFCEDISRDFRLTDLELWTIQKHRALMIEFERNSSRSRKVVERFLAGGREDDFVGEKYGDVLQDCLKKYLKSPKILSPFSSKEKRIKELQTSCKDLTTKLDSVEFKTLYVASLNEPLKLKTLVRAHKVCELLLKADSNSLVEKLSNESEEKCTSCLTV